MRILGIESSCDETSAAVVETDGRRFCVLSNVVSSQMKIHEKYGGVVPEVAARNHVGKILPVITKALEHLPRRQAGKSTKTHIDRIAVTVGPGLLTSLLVGVETAKTLSCIWKVPIVPVNHMAGHTYSALLPALENPNDKIQMTNKFQRSKSKDLKIGSSLRFGAWDLKFPAMALLVSGGHTELVLMQKHGSFKLVGQTIDDAAGEAFDKIAKMLDLGYPGGPVIDRLAQTGNPHAIAFPRAWLGKESLDFSFSGLKTSVLYHVKDRTRYPLHVTRYDKANICASVQQAIVDVLVAKTLMAARRYKVNTVLLGGGVAANRQLRHDLGAALATALPRVQYRVPERAYTTDNAAMIAAAGFFEKPKPWEKIMVDPNLPLGGRE